MKNENNLGSTTQFEEAYQCLLEELSVWRGRLTNEPSFLIQAVSSTLLKYRDFSFENFKAEYFTPVLDKITKQWFYHCDEAAVETSFTLNDSEVLDSSVLYSSFIFKEDGVCASCNEYRAHLDHLEIQNVRETESYEEKIRSLNKQLTELTHSHQKAWDKLKKGFSLETVYVDALSHIRRDAENLLDCDLPSIVEDPLEQIPLLCKEMRKVLATTAKKARGRTVQVRNKDYYNCSLEEFKRSILQSIEIFNQSTWKKQIVKVNIGELSVPLQITSEEPSHYELKRIQTKDELENLVITLTQEMNEVFFNSKIEKYRKNSNCVKEEELQKIQELNLENEETIKKLNEKIECMKDKFKYIKLLIGENEWRPHPPIKLDLKLDEILERHSKPKEEKCSDDITKLNQEIATKQKELKSATSTTVHSQLSREINTLRSKVSDLRMSKVLEHTNSLTSKLQRSLACIEKQWISKDEQSRTKHKLSFANKHLRPIKKQNLISSSLSPDSIEAPKKLSYPNKLTLTVDNKVHKDSNGSVTSFLSSDALTQRVTIDDHDTDTDTAKIRQAVDKLNTANQNLHLIRLDFEKEKKLMQQCQSHVLQIISDILR